MKPACIFGLFRDRNFILILAIVLGLIVGQVADFTQVLVLPALAMVMTLSTSSLTSQDFARLKSMPGPIIISIILSYLVLGGVILLLGWWLIKDPDLWAGFVILAAVPPAVAVVPYSYMLFGNTYFSLIGMIGAYMVALVLTPVMMMLFLGVDFINPMRLVNILVQLIVIPLILSRVLLFTGLSRRIEKWRGTMVNWGFFLVIFTIIGLNREVFFGQFEVLLKIAVIGFAITFVLGHIIEFAARALKVDRETTISLVLMGTMKNFGLASAIALALFSERASIPGAIFIIFAVLYVVWLGFYLKKWA